MDKFSENLNNPPPEYDQLTDVMLDGLWYGNLDLNKEAFLTFIYRLTNVKRKFHLIFTPTITHSVEVSKLTLRTL